MSAYEGTAGSCYHSIRDLTEPMQPMNVKDICKNTDHHTRNSMPYSFQIVSGLASHKRICALTGCETVY